jgi:hypothetical protein
MKPLPLTLLKPFITDGAKVMLRLFLGVAVVLFIIHALLSIFFPYPLDYGEAPLVDQAMRLAAGQNIYRTEVALPPYTIANYPPVYPLALAPFAHSGVAFLAGRAISVLSAIATAIFLGLIIYYASQDRLSALASGAIFLAIPYVVHWSGLLRVDLLALALSTAALYLLIRSSGSRWGIAGAGLLLVAAIYTRQSYALAAPLAAVAWLWSQERRRAIELALLVGGLSLILFVLLNILTGGGFFFNIVTANVNEFIMTQLNWNLGNLASTAPILLILGVLLLFFGRGRMSLWPLLALYLIGGTISALTIGKIGSNVNYFLELSAALSLAAGAFLVWSQAHPWRLTALLVLLTLQTGLLVQSTLAQAFDERLSFRRRDEIALGNLANIIAETDGPILADEFMGLITMQQRPIYMQPFEVTQLARAQRWDQATLLQDIEQQQFPLILIYQLPAYPLHKERWTPEMLAAIEKNYRPVRIEASTVIYRPQEGQAGLAIPSPSRGDSFKPETIQLGPLRRVTQAPYVLQPQISVSPTNPEHLAALVMTSSFASCNDLSRCQTDLLLYLSTDGGATWTNQRPFSQPRQFTTEGNVGFGPDGSLYVLGIRDGAIVLNKTDPDAAYEFNRSNQNEVTRAQVAARPWLRVDPESGDLFLTYAAQYRDTLATPSLNRSSDAGANWSFTARVDQSVAIADIENGRVAPPGDIHVMLGEDNQVALVWVWRGDTGGWPRDLWLAVSSDGGENFSSPRRIGETWGPIQAASDGDNYYIVHQSGSPQTQALALAISQNNGRTWTSTMVSGRLPIATHSDKGPAIGVAPDGTLDLLFYALDESATACVAESAPSETGSGDRCVYDVYYTYSRDGGQSFSEPLLINELFIRANRFVQMAGFSLAGPYLGIASSDTYAYPIWINTEESEGTQMYTRQIER